ncbi:hypothetical protein [Ignatzschineria ureiclastica]|uniref:hypothetical protein n=1 Tax=Ignatzschineria ureiclastica TaxID=472582 RepID=UPI0010578265|nr:hypothetical protein [Ignatzschineria ureiclastica]
MSIQENDKKLETTERNQQAEKSDSRQKRYKSARERGAILLEVIIASLFLLLVMSAGNRLLGFYHLNYQKVIITHQVLMQKQND